MTADQAQRVQRELARLLSGRAGPISLQDRQSIEAQAYAAAGVQQPIFVDAAPLPFSQGPSVAPSAPASAVGGTVTLSAEDQYVADALKIDAAKFLAMKRELASQANPYVCHVEKR